MQNSFLEGLEVFSNTLVPIVLALAACIVKVAKDGWKGIKIFIQNFIIGAFVGVLVYWGLDYWNLPPTVHDAITGGCVYVSRSFLDILQEKIVTTIREWHIRRKDS